MVIMEGIMAFGDNGLPLGPGGKFPKQRISSYGNMIDPPRNMEEEYMYSPIANIPAPEKEYSSVVNRAKNHMNFGEAKRRYPKKRTRMVPKGLKQAGRKMRMSDV